MKSLSQKPFYSSKTVIIFLPICIWILYEIAVVVLRQKTMHENYLDKVFHFVGAVSMYFSAAGILWHLMQRKVIEIHDANVFRLLAYGILCFAVIGWEIMEYLGNIIDPGELTNPDTVTDMISGLAGGLLAMLCFRQPEIRKHPI